jgi:anti-sigma28 factor (negative regulator of flagellin synthesis)
MTEISPINGAIPVTSAESLEAKRPVGESRLPRAEQGDRVEISQAGRALSEARPTGESPAEKIARIRQQIAQGNYETEDKIAVTIDRLLDVLRTTPAT